MSDKSMADAMKCADELYRRQNMRHIDDADYPRTLREIDIRNINCRIEWERRKRFGFVYSDSRGEVGGAVIDAKLASKARLAKNLRDKVVKERRMQKWREEKAERDMEPSNVVSMFHRPQAS